MLALYASTANAERKQELINAFNTVLDERVDFDALYESVLKENQTNSLPTMAWFSTRKRYKYNPALQDTLYWDLTLQTDLGEYTFAIPMRISVEEAKTAYRKKGWHYVSDNRRETQLRYGLV